MNSQILNGDFTGGRTNFVSDYTFDVVASVRPGFFTIQTNSHGANYRYAKFGDHTTGTGKMLLVDGHTNANKTVWSQKVGVAPNTAYLFSAWATSADSSSAAVLQFMVNNVQLASDFLLSTDAGHWQRFVGVWNSGTNVLATLKIVDANVAYLGNDFALDDLSFNAITNRVGSVAIYPAIETAWSSKAGGFYQVQYSTALDTNLWFNLGGPIQSGELPLSVFDSTREDQRRFYRVLPLE